MHIRRAMLKMRSKSVLSTRSLKMPTLGSSNLSMPVKCRIGRIGHIQSKVCTPI